MKASLALLLLIINFAFAADLNSNGWTDTSMILKFKADSTQRSKAFNLSGWENVRFDMKVMDTANSKTGFSGAAIKFYWWYETGHLGLNYLPGKYDTVWSMLDPVLIDTFDITTAGNMVKAPRLTDSLGNFRLPRLTIDTLSVRGFATQSRLLPAVEWDEFIRIGMTGLTGNRTDAGGFIKAMVAMHRRAAVGTRAR